MAGPSGAPAPAIAPSSGEESPLLRVAVAVTGAIFLLSGATSLVYQVAWMRTLSLFLGSDVDAAATTLSVFMAGLSLGSWLSGRVADRLERPLLAYGLCELGVAACAVAFPHVLPALHGSYQAIYRQHFATAPWIYHGFRVLVAAAALLPPTLLMGATLPLVVRQFAARPELLGRRVGQFYAWNTLGALLGTVAGGFALIPALGVSTTVKAAVAVNIAIGAGAVALALRLRAESAHAGPGRERSAPPRLDPVPFGDRRRPWVAVAIGLSGLAALALEVVWMRVLVQSFSGTVYSFAIMLASFLLGLFAGSRAVSERLDQHPDPAGLLCHLELWIGATVGVLALLTYALPGLFCGLLWSLTGITGGAFGFASVVAQFAVAMALIALPTALLGATFPVSIKAYTRDIEARAASTGAIYAANTAGAVLGSLLGGYLLLPLFGARGGMIAIAALFCAAGLAAAAGAGLDPLARLRQPIARLPLLVAAACACAGPLLPPQTVINFNLRRSARPEVLYHGEGVSHSVDIVRNSAGNVIMSVDGNVEADTSAIQRRHFILKAHLPLLLHPDPRRVAVVGLGLGVTLAATLRHPTVEGVQLIELSPEMVTAHRQNPGITGGVLDNPRLRLRIDDGRNFMAMAEDRFDMITADPIHPRITGVGYLYTREYYQLIKERLAPGGIVTQWMPMYQIAPGSFDVAFRTFASVFENASFWYVRGHGLFVATTGDFAIDYPALARRFQDPAVRADMGSVQMDTPERFLGHLLMDREHIARYLARDRATPAENRVNTDDNAWLEYHTPFEYLGRTDAIVDQLLPYAGWDVDRLLRGAPDEVRARVKDEVAARRACIPRELREPIE